MTLAPTLDLADAARRWDVLVIGAGPAGAVAALETARRGLSVLLVDRAAFPRAKVCGCCLSARALHTLTVLGLGRLPASEGAVPLRAVTLGACGSRAVLPLPGGVALSRERFDAGLVAAAVEGGAHFLPSVEARLRPGCGEIREVTLARGPRDVTASALVVLAADGLGGRFLAGETGQLPRVAEGSRIGAGVVLADGPSFYGPGQVFIACGAAGYVGLVRLEDGRLDVAAALDRATVRRSGGPGRAAAGILREAGWPDLSGLVGPGWRGTPPLTRQAPRLASHRVLVLGDAAGYVEPFTGEGMAWALDAAVAIAPVAARAARGWDAGIEEEWAREHDRVVTRRQQVCQAAAWVLRHPVLARAAIHLLGRWPGLATPVLHRLNAPSPDVDEVLA
jgi:flavin-dependent dehydrogenase